MLVGNVKKILVKEEINKEKEDEVIYNIENSTSKEVYQNSKNCLGSELCNCSNYKTIYMLIKDQTFVVIFTIDKIDEFSLKKNNYLQ
ncbi:hypothetical protein CR513_62534, partial [Mucuna pruriens]